MCLHSSVKCRYNVVQYNMILHTSLLEMRQNINLNPQKTSPKRDLWGVVCEYGEEILAHYNDTAMYIAVQL